MAREQEPITPESRYLDRRTIIRAMGLGVAGLSTLSFSGWLRGISTTGAAQFDNSEAFRPAIGDLHKALFPAKRSDKYKIAPLVVTE